MIENLSDEHRAAILSSALEQIADSVMITDTSGVIKYVNDSFEVVTGYTREEAIGQRASLVKSGKHSEIFYRSLWATLRAGRPFRHVFINRRKGGAIYHEAKTITPVRDKDGDITHFVATGRDVSERVETESRLERLAYTDSLTGLPNRQRFLELVRDALEQSVDTGSNARFAVLFLDMDGFKAVNDSFGHFAGDHLLGEVAERLGELIREPDVLARLGGDEFAILLHDVGDATPVAADAQRILDAFRPPFDVSGVATYVDASIGIALAPDHGTEVFTLIKHADTAMYRAKKHGGSYCFFEPEMTASVHEQFNLRNGLYRALERGELSLDYQPQIDLTDGSVRAVEALLRWCHPRFGVVSPELFVPVLEDIGLIHEVGRWVVREACQQLRTWWAARVPVPMVAVNVSPLQLEDPEFVDSVVDAVQRFGLPPAALELELVETANLAVLDKVEAGIRRLESVGVRLALDDFGTGFSAFSHLSRFPVHGLKIDRDFVAGISALASNESLIEGIMAVAEKLGLDVVAEGIETADQLVRLQQLGCKCGQGFYFCAPSAPDVIREFMQRQAPLLRTMVSGGDGEVQLRPSAAG